MILFRCQLYSSQSTDKCWVRGWAVSHCALVSSLCPLFRGVNVMSDLGRGWITCEAVRVMLRLGVSLGWTPDDTGPSLRC